MNLDDSFGSTLFLTTAVNDFNAKPNKWSESGRLTTEVSKTDFLTSQFGLSNNQRTHAHL